jgi:hypothetical protein
MAKGAEDTGDTCRTTVTIPKTDHAQLAMLAKSKHVSFGWMVREAIRVYLDQQTPLFRSQRGASP